MYDYRQNWMTQNPDTIKHNRCNFRKKKYIQDKYLQQGPCPKQKIWKFLSFLFRVSGCCYGYCDQFGDRWIQQSGLSMIGCFSCLIIANCLITLSDYNCTA